MTRAAHLRQRATAVAWRGARAARNTARRVARRGPEVSVIVPFYGVEKYLAECLDSLLAQSFVDFEALLIDDGSLDGSRRIADEYAARDPRLRVVERPNGGLGAARNTGVREASGRFLTFVDSDDVLPSHALAVLVASARQSGADIVCGSVERFDSRNTWAPSWVDDVHRVRRTGIVLDDFLPLLRNLYTWNKLFRRDFYTAQGLEFREGVAYEDQPIITELFAAARSIDVLPDIVYRYRQRDDKSSISQQTASLKDLRDRIEAWRVSAASFRRVLSPAAYDGWLATLFEAHFQWYLQSTGTVDDTYWDELTAAIRELASDAPPEVWRGTSVAQRVLVRLALDGRRADAQELVRRDGVKSENWPAVAGPDGIRLEIPFHDDPDLDPDLFVIHPEQVHISHAVENVHWVRRDDGVLACYLAGWAYLRKVDLARHEQTVTVLLRDPASGAEHAFLAADRPTSAYAPPRDDLWCDYRPGRFGVEVDLAALVAAGDASWEVWLRVEAAGLTAERPVTRLVRSGAAGHIPALALGSGRRVIAEWSYQQMLRLRSDSSGAALVRLQLDGDVLTGTVAAADLARVGRITLGAGRRVEEARWGAADAEGRTFSVTVPADAPEPGRHVTWSLSGWTGRGQRLELLPLPDAVPPHTGGTLSVGTARTGGTQVTRWSWGAHADRVDIGADGVLTVSGRVHGGRATQVRLATLNKRMNVEGEPAPVVDGRFEARIALRHERYRFGALPLSVGDHDVRIVLAGDAPDAGHAVPLLTSEGLGDTLPLPIATDELEGRVVRGPGSGVRLTILRPLGEGRGQYQQHLMRRRGPVRSDLVRGLLVRSYFGESATDSGVSIQKELARRGSDLPVYWAVQDRSIPIPDGGIPVIVNSPQWFELLFSAQYYLDNMYQPEYHVKAPGQVLVQTFHGYPFKLMGHRHWRNIQFSQARIDAYDARAADWDYLVSPARYATPLLTTEFNYPGTVLEIGYPRNDVLNSAEAPQLRETVRRTLGIRPDQKAVLYAPTFRDYLAEADTKAVMPEFFDFRLATEALGEEYVFLVRGHAFNARTDQRLARVPGCIEVTDYPEVSDLYLASDAAIVDYSSLRFDYGVTGKPMVFHVPDLQRYKDTRGWLFDFEPTAPGPLLDTTEEVVEALRDLDALAREHATAYERFQADFLDLDDGRAAERFVDAVFVPRGDA